jgi:hypothetical protein
MDNFLTYAFVDDHIDAAVINDRENITLQNTLTYSNEKEDLITLPTETQKEEDEVTHEVFFGENIKRVINTLFHK